MNTPPRHTQTCMKCQGAGGVHQHVTTLSNGREVRWVPCDHERDWDMERLTDEEAEIQRLELELHTAHLEQVRACGMAFAFGQLQADHERCYAQFANQERRLGQVLELEDSYLDVITDLQRRVASCPN